MYYKTENLEEDFWVRYYNNKQFLALYFEEKIENIYQDSKYLQKVRFLVAQFSCGNCCENCIGQYYMNLKKQEEKNG